MNAVFGLIFAVGIGVTIMTRRVGTFLVQPLVLLVLACWANKRLRACKLLEATHERGHVIAALLLACFGTVAFHLWRQQWSAADGSVLIDHSDYGYYSMLAKGVTEAKVFLGWAATTGASAVEAGRTQDTWYHWGPIWLGMLLTRMTGIAEIESVLVSGAMISTLIALVLAACIVRVLTGWGHVKSLLLGAISLLAMPYPEALRSFSPFSHVEHSRECYYWFISYYYEAVLVLSIVLSWLRGRQMLTLALIVCATLSAPHFVGGVGTTVGVLMCLGFMLRKRELFLPAMRAVGIILLTWAAIHFVLKLSTNVSNEVAKVSFSHFLTALFHGGLSVVLGLGVCALFLPGWIGLMRTRADGRITDDTVKRVRLLGWAAFSGLAGGMMATYLMRNSQELHFTDFPCTLLAMPAGIWGLARLTDDSDRCLRAFAWLSILATASFGVMTLQRQKGELQKMPWSVTQMNKVMKELRGEPFGYFTSEDRSWWIPKYGFAAALMDSRCIRLHPLKSADIDNNFSAASQDYLPMEMVPYAPGEPMHAWALKLMHHLRIRYLLRTRDTMIPEEILQRCDLVCGGGELILYRLRE